MQAETIVKVCLDILMTVMLLLLMAYDMIGQAPMNGWESEYSCCL